jgi:hypothetical protein
MNQRYTQVSINSQSSPPMNDFVPPIEQCDVLDKASLASYRTKAEKWWRWLKTDDHHALWPQIYSMLIGDMTFQTLAVAAEADKDSALNSPIIQRGLLQGYAATQGVAIRRLVDTSKKVISLRKLLDDIKNNIRLLTRENYVSGSGLPYDADRAVREGLTNNAATGFWANTGQMAFMRSMQAHGAFDRLTGTQSGPRDRSEKIPKRLIDTIETWLKEKEIEDVVDWSNKCIAHAADQASYQGINLAALAPTVGKISIAQRHIVRAAEAISTCLLRGPIHGQIVPVFQYSQFSRFEMAGRDPQAIAKAKQRWNELAKERDQWTSGIWDELTGGGYEIGGLPRI